MERGTAVRTVVEDFGASPTAERFGIDRYPAVWVGDVLLARPEDFYGWENPLAVGRYTPWQNPASQARFRDDLRRLIDAGSGPSGPGPAILGELSTTDVEGHPLGTADLAGREVSVLFWSRPCAPCMAALAALAREARSDPEHRVAVAVALALDPSSARSVVGHEAPGVRGVLGPPLGSTPFGEAAGVPELRRYDAGGRLVRVARGAAAVARELATARR